MARKFQTFGPLSPFCPFQGCKGQKGQKGPKGRIAPSFFPILLERTSLRSRIVRMRFRLWFPVLAACGLAGFLFMAHEPGPRQSGRLDHAFYVWQRAWTADVSEAVAGAPSSAKGLAPLAAEVSWREGRAEVTRPAVDFAALRKSAREVSAVLRIGPCKPGSADEVCKVAGEVVSHFRAELPKLAELQVDFDCATSQLAGYRAWLAALRSVVAPLPVRPTVLPSWLGAPEFPALARESGGYILQVHATERPKIDAPETALCDVEQAREWVERAGRIGVPFRAALPTYTYVVAFAPDRKVLGITAEGEARLWPPGTVTRAFRPDAAQFAALIASWEKDRPAALSSVLWYRFPVAADTLNWRWPTLNAVLAGRAPRRELRVEKTSPVDITIFNAGESEEPVPKSLVTHGEDADGAGGYRAEINNGEIVFERSPELAVVRIAPGARYPVGWVRSENENNVYVRE